MEKKPHTPHPIGTPGPFEVIESSYSKELASPSTAPRRRYECSSYDSCLDLAAALDWDSFTCRGCSAEVNQSLIWRAHQAKRNDNIARSICRQVPVINILKPEILIRNDSQNLVELSESSNELLSEEC